MNKPKKKGIDISPPSARRFFRKAWRIVRSFRLLSTFPRRPGRGRYQWCRAYSTGRASSSRPTEGGPTTRETAKMAQRKRYHRPCLVSFRFRLSSDISGRPVPDFSFPRVFFGVNRAMFWPSAKTFLCLPTTTRTPARVNTVKSNSRRRHDYDITLLVFGPLN